MVAIPQLRTRDFRRRTLRSRQRPVIRAFAEALFSHDVWRSPQELDEFVDNVDAYISPASKTLRFALLVLIELLRMLPLLLFITPRTFPSLSVTERVNILERMERSRISHLCLVFIAWKSILTIVYFEDAERLRAIGYPGTVRTRYKRGLPVTRADAAKSEARESEASSS